MIDRATPEKEGDSVVERWARRFKYAETEEEMIGLIDELKERARQFRCEVFERTGRYWWQATSD